MDVFAVLADPVRRAVLVALRDGPLPAGAIAGRFPVSRPAVSRHLRLLREAGLVVHEAHGRQRLSRLEPAPLEHVTGWVASLRPTWDGRLDALETEVHRTRRERRNAGGAARAPAPSRRQERSA